MPSLRRRAIVAAVLWTALTVTIAGAALAIFFNGLSERRFNEALAARHRQAVIAVANTGGDPEGMELYLSDPLYAQPLSGRYWQLVAPDGTLVASRSLFDETLPGTGPAPEDAPAFWTGAGPEGRVRGLHQAITLEDGSVWTVAVAEALATLWAERQQTLQSLVAVFGMVGVLGVLGGLAQASFALRPLGRLRADVAHRWDRGEALEPASYPDEVAPLVRDINVLLGRNRAVVDVSRRQAADLAHALKTPVAVLRNEIERLQPEGGMETAAEALDRIDAQMLRALARIRAGNAAAAGQRTEVLASVERLARLFRRAPDAAGLTLGFDIAADIAVGVDRQDLEEMLGNVIENAVRWRRSAVEIGAEDTGPEVVLTVDDDGPGIPEASRDEALRAGGRLDTSAPGTGLGLAIVADLAAAYGGGVTLGTAPDLGGLRVTITLPSRFGLPPAEGGATA